MIRTILSWLASLLLAVPYLSRDASDYLYLVVLGAVILLVIINKRKFKRISYHEDLYPVAFVSVWFIGVLVGMLYDNPIGYIFRNFFGMVVYVLYFPLKNNGYINKGRVWRVVYRASIIATAEIIVCVAMHRIGRIVPWPLSNIPYSVYRSGINMGGCTLLPYVLFTDTFFVLFSDNNASKFKSFGLLILSSIACIGFATQSSEILAYFALTAVMLLVVLKRKKQRKSTVLLALLAVSIAILVTILFEYNTGGITSIFSSEDGGNIKRNTQIGLVLGRLKLFGNGLGSVFEYYLGYGGTYAIEISYLNLIDKFGLFALPLLYIYVRTLIKPIKRATIISEFNADRYAVMSIGLCAYLFSSLGNPTLFAAYNVTLHVLSIYLCLESAANTRQSNKDAKATYIARLPRD